jgi:hypothetical protein
MLTAEFCAGYQILLLLLPVIRHRTIFCQVVVVVKLFLLLDDAVKHLVDLVPNILPNPCKS